MDTKQLRLFNDKPDKIKSLEQVYGLKLKEVASDKVWEQKNSFSLDKKKNIIGLNLDIRFFSSIYELRHLNHLQTLSFRGTQVSDIEILSQLYELKELDISETLVQTLEPIRGLKRLEILDFSSTEVQSIDLIKDLTRLRELYFSETSIQDIESIQHLKQLQILNCSSSHVQNLEPIRHLTKLRELYLDWTKVQNLEPIKNLNQLETLDLRYCRIEYLPLFLTEWEYWNFNGWKDSLDRYTISLYGNPLKNITPEIIDQGKEAVHAHLLALEANKRANPRGIMYQTAPLNEVKVVLVGNGGSGKTSLLKRLIGEKFDEKEDQTHGIRIYQHDMMCVEDEVKVNFWDFGGQEINHATHQFFYSKRAVYLLVLDARHEDKAEYWLKYIENLGGASPVLIVLNKIDKNPSFDVDRKFLMDKYGERVQAFYRLSCKEADKGDGIARLAQDLQKALYELEFRKSPIAGSWFAVKEDLVAMASEKDYINYAAYDAICAKHEVRDKVAKETLLHLLDDLGIVLHFEELRRYDKQVLSPLWLTQGVYRIINSPLIADEREGEVFFEDLEGILNDFERYHSEEERRFRYPTDTHIYLLEIMQQFELCYELERDHYIVPDLLPKQQPEGLDWEDYPLHFVLEYEGLLPRSVLPRFMVRMHKSIVEGAQNRWRTGVVLQNPLYNATAVVRADYAEHEIHVWVNGEQRREMLTFIRSSLREINKSFQKLEVIEWLVIGKKGKKLVQVDYEELLILEEERRAYYSTKLRKEFQPKALLNGIELPEVRGRQPLQAFISYSQKDLDLKNAFKTMLHPLKHTHQLELWDEREIDAGAEREAEIIRHLQYDPLIFLLLSPDFIATERIWDIEIPKALERHRRGEAVVIPIILRPCRWENLDFSELQALPQEAKPISTWDDQDHVLLETAKAIEKVLEGARIRKLREQLLRRW